MYSIKIKNQIRAHYAPEPAQGRITIGEVLKDHWQRAYCFAATGVIPLRKKITAIVNSLQSVHNVFQFLLLGHSLDPEHPRQPHFDDGHRNC